MTTIASFLDGIIDADPVWVAVAISALVAGAIALVVLRVRRRGKTP